MCRDYPQSDGREEKLDLSDRINANICLFHSYDSEKFISNGLSSKVERFLRVGAIILIQRAQKASRAEV
jgi:hypothetical protein